MTDFDKVAYWKKRANDAIQGHFDTTVVLMKNVRQTLYHIGGVEPIELERLIKEVGDTYNELADLVKNCEPKKKEPKIITLKNADVSKG